MSAIILHNTYAIKSMNAHACQMFKCDRDMLIGRSLLDLIPDLDMRALVKLRLAHIRTKGNLRAQPLPLLRPDGSVFWADVKTRKISTNLWESTLKYDHEQINWVQS